MSAIRLRVPGAGAGRSAAPAYVLTAWGWALAALFALAGVCLVLAATSRYGAGVTADSAAYVSAARSFADGEGWLTYGGQPLVVHPPGLSLLLALPASLGIDPAVAARYVNALAFGLTLLVAAAWLLGRVRNPGLALLAPAVLLLCRPLVWVGATVWSEAVFILLVLLCLVALGRYLAAGGWRPLLAGGALAGAACLIRYAGAPLVAVGLLTVVLRRADPRPRRLRGAAGFVALALGPVLLWLIRNWHLSGTLFGGRVAGSGDVLSVAALSGRIMWGVFLPETGAPGAAWAAWAAVAAVAALAGWAWWAGRDRGPAPSTPGMVPLAVFAAGYWAFIVLVKARIGVLEPRYMYPAVVPLVLVAVAWLDGVLARARPRLPRARAHAAAVVALLAVWLAAYPAAATLRFVATVHRLGVPDFTTESWQERAIVRLLADSAPRGYAYSNAPDVIYWTTGRYAAFVPHGAELATADGRKAFRERVRRRLEAGTPLYLILFRMRKRHDRADVPDLNPLLRLRPLWRAPDGSGRVFRVLGIKPPFRTATR